MKVLINAITITDGGGIVVLKNLLNAMCSVDPNIHWYVACNKSIAEQIPAGETVTPLSFSWARKSPLHLYYWYEYTLPTLVRRIGADVCFSQTNFLPRSRLSCPALLLIHNAGFFSELFTRLHLNVYRGFKDKLLWRKKLQWSTASIRKASAVTVQTQALADKIVNTVGIDSNKVITIPHGSGLLIDRVPAARIFPGRKTWRIGYITKFGVQKDFATLIKAARLLHQNKVSFKLVLTLNESMQEFAAIKSLLREYEIDKFVENHGETASASALEKIYDSLDLFVFPSLVESFGFTLVEAMASGLPIIAADTESNREIAAAAAKYFIQQDETSLAAQLLQIIQDRDEYESMSSNSLARSKMFCWQDAANKMVSLLKKTAGV